MSITVHLDPASGGLEVSHESAVSWHIDDKGQLHVIGSGDSDASRSIASYARGAWTHVSKDIPCDGQERVIAYTVGDDAWAHGKAMAEKYVAKDQTLTEADAKRGQDVYHYMVDTMCPNCVTPWKCNGPHILPDEA